MHQTPPQAAAALRPLAGDFAFYLFGLGILGGGAIGVPVSAGSAGYTLAEAMGWHSSLETSARQAQGFHGVIAASMLVGLSLGFYADQPNQGAFCSAVINGVVAVPLIVVGLLLASSALVMGKYAASAASRVLGWITPLRWPLPAL
jgi:Mn2+/Fe2+ NRAMP family transporter